MHREPEITNESKYSDTLNNMYLSIINTIKMASCQKEEIFPVIEVLNNDFTTQTHCNSRS